MPENNGTAQSLILTDKAMRAVRKALTRKAGGSFETCDDHERRLKVASFALAIYADPSQASVIVKATVHVSCGHSKNPCKDSRTITLADDTGISSKALKAVSKVNDSPEIDENEDENEDETVAA